MMWSNGEGWGWGAWLAMTLMMLIFWGGIAWVVVTLIQHNGTWPTRDQPAPSADPLRILDERFARGEIDDDDYRRRAQHAPRDQVTCRNELDEAAYGSGDFCGEPTVGPEHPETGAPLASGQCRFSAQR